MKYCLVLAVSAVFMFILPTSAFAGDCCGPDDSSCCPGDIITGGIVGIGVEVAEDVNEANERPASDNLEQALARLLWELMKALGADKPAESNASKPKISAWKIELIHKYVSSLTNGQKVSNAQFDLTVTAATNSPLVRKFTYKRKSSKKTFVVTYKATKNKISLTWTD